MPKSLIAFLLMLALTAICVAGEKPIITDDSITDQVRMKLANDQVVKGGALLVNVEKGVVTLSGQIPTDKQKDRAAKVAAKVKGVKKVVNNITVQNQRARQ